MLYLTTRNNQETYTANRALTEFRAPDGGFYVPFRMPVFSREEIQSLSTKSFGQCVSEVLNKLFGTHLTAWDIDCTVGRSPMRLRPITQRIILGEIWHNLDWNFKSTVSGILSLLTEEKIPSDWAMIGIRIAVLFGIFGTRPYYEMQGASTEIVESGIAYTSICCIFTMGIYFEVLFERMLQATGRTLHTMVTQGVGAVVRSAVGPTHREYHSLL